MFKGMIRRPILLLGITGVAMAASAPAAMAGSSFTYCPIFNNTDSSLYQGTAKNLIVPANQACVIYGATITKNVTLEPGSFFAAESSTIGANLISHGAAVIDTGVYYTPGGKGPGPVAIGHNVVLTGSSYNLDFCDTTVGHDFKVNGLKNAFELQIGDTSKNNLDYKEGFYSCQGGTLSEPYSLSPPVHIKHNLTITNSTVGLLDVSNDTIGHNLTVENVVATYDTEGLEAGQGMWVANDTIGRNANCVNLTPALASGGIDAAQNTAGKVNNCKF